MSLLISGLLFLAGGACATLLIRRNVAAGVLGAGSALAGGVALVLASAGALTAQEVALWQTRWSLPIGALSLRLDPLAAVFLVPLAVVGPLCAVYGVAYLRNHRHDRPIGASLAAYNLLLLSMAIVVTANDLVLLLVAWELMTLSSWALVVSDHGERSARTAGLQYLIAGHIATACLVLLFLLLANGSGSFEIAAQAGRAPAMSGILFALALIGFGTKAGIAPFHVWLPDAHPAAPSHVSALMSAVMITMGFYGLARFLPLLGPAASWWPYVFLLLGSLGAVGGIAFALAQRDVKRALAWSTIENAGIVTVAIGIGLLGATLNQPLLAALGWTAALLHLVNHAFAKALLFLGFGAIAQGAGDRGLEAHGGFLARWPLVGGLLVLGCAAIAALPGLNLFTSEWLLLRGLLLGTVALPDVAQFSVIGIVTFLAFASGLAVACFARIAGIGLLGSPRTSRAASAPPPGIAMWLPLIPLAVGCVLIGLLPHRAVAALAMAVSGFVPQATTPSAPDVLRPLALLTPLLVVVAMPVLVLLRGHTPARALRERAMTWGCGFPDTAPSMQYTAASFSQPLTQTLRPVLRTEVVREIVQGEGAGLRSMTWASSTPDRLLIGLYRPVFSLVGRVGERMRELHQPRVSRSLLYIVLTMVILLGLLFLPALRP